MSNAGLIQHIRNPPQPPTPYLVISKVFLSAIPIAQIAIGSVYLDECPANRYIPVYLIVVGVVGLALNFLACLPCARKSKDDPPTPLSRVCRAWNTLTSFFLFCWFITGNVWIYSIYKPNFHRNGTQSDDYCHKTLYLFAFWTTTLVYILFALIVMAACCILVCRFLLGHADADDV